MILAYLRLGVFGAVVWGLGFALLSYFSFIIYALLLMFWLGFEVFADSVLFLGLFGFDFVYCLLFISLCGGFSGGFVCCLIAFVFSYECVGCFVVADLVTCVEFGILLVLDSCLGAG